MDAMSIASNQCVVNNAHLLAACQILYSEQAMNCL